MMEMPDIINENTSQIKSVKLTTLCYIEQNEKYLMLYRNKRRMTRAGVNGLV